MYIERPTVDGSEGELDELGGGVDDFHLGADETV